MLVVMHDGNVEGLLQTFLNIETLRGFDVFQVDTSESGGDTFYCLAELLRILLSNLDIKHIDAAIDLKQQTFSLHHGFAAHGTDVAES